MDFKSTKGPLKTTTLIGWMWKRGDTWSWPVLITRAAWPYNTQEVLMVDIKLDENKTLVFNANWLLSDKLNGKQFCLVTIASGNHLNPSRTQKWKRFAPMIVWEFPCESRSTPGIYSKQKGLSRKTGPFLFYNQNTVLTYEHMEGKASHVTKISGIFLNRLQAGPEGVNPRTGWIK